MLPVLFGGITLAAVGYGINRCLNNEDCMDDLKERIQDGVLKAYDGLDKLDQMIGEHKVVFSAEDILYQNGHDESNVNKMAQEFQELYKLKINVVKNIQKKHNLYVCDIDEIKKDKVNNFKLIDEVQANLNWYSYLIKALYFKIEKFMKENDQDQINLYLEAIKNICKTKLIKKSQLNEKSTEVILKATKLLLGEKEPMRLEIDL